MLNFEIKEHICDLGIRSKWELELNLVSWDGREPKYDIRPWSEGHERGGKGITFSEDEIRKLKKALDEYFGDEKR